MLGLYLHIPFCTAICNYCNFNRGLFDAGLKVRYVDALEREIRGTVPQGGDPVPADTIYFGGGTPSLLEPGEVGRLIRACQDTFAMPADAEVTLEANPESVSEARLAGFLTAGANRLSFGVQSFHDEELTRLSRLHTASRARDAFAEARAAGFDNISVDLMMWLPGQDVARWLASVDAAIALEPEHVSMYMLEVYPNAPLREEMARAQWSQAPDDDVARMYEASMERMEAAGLQQYEISNVARAGRESRHNLKYWTDGEWAGFGCGAHSTRAGVRWKNAAGAVDYIEAIGRGESPAVDAHRMSPQERLGDALFTGLRLVDGVDLAAVERRYGVDVMERFGEALQPFITEDLLERQSGRLRLTRRGMLLAHEVMSVFV